METDLGTPVIEGPGTGSWDGDYTLLGCLGGVVGTGLSELAVVGSDLKDLKHEK